MPALVFVGREIFQGF